MRTSFLLSILKFVQLIFIKVNYFQRILCGAGAILLESPSYSGKPSDLYDIKSPDWALTLNLGHEKVSSASTSQLGWYERGSRK